MAEVHIPFCMIDVRCASRAASRCLLYSLSIAASKDMIVSSGRSVRRRVGLEKSGSAVYTVNNKMFLTYKHLSKTSIRTNGCALRIKVLILTKLAKRSLFKLLLNYDFISIP
jgi:hypothetical protein